MYGPAGHDAAGPAETVSPVLPLTNACPSGCSDADTVGEPAAMPVTRPVAVILAGPAGRADQATQGLMSTLLPLLNRPAALYCSVPGIEIVALAGLTLIDVSVTPLPVAVSVVVAAYGWPATVT